MPFIALPSTPKEFVRFIKPREIIPTVYGNAMEQEAMCKRFRKFVNMQALKHDFIAKMKPSSFPSPSSPVDVESPRYPYPRVPCEEREFDDSLDRHKVPGGGGAVSHDQCDVSSLGPNIEVHGSSVTYVKMEKQKKRHCVVDPMGSKLLKDGEWVCEVLLLHGIPRSHDITTLTALFHTQLYNTQHLLHRELFLTAIFIIVTIASGLHLEPWTGSGAALRVPCKPKPTHFCCMFISVPTTSTTLTHNDIHVCGYSFVVIRGINGVPKLIIVNT